ncbi:hypothetical protein DRW07_10210 [Alteromonas sediminis]|uniref:Uncharacterized protein n=1 Tax=Alteromonas sediminis TaxID=2259342 RepID=A0A3N5Y739_9ALTE|nr:hypothetical protein [Alteromonas sediminis]RPJ66459.1 hypothetical protein DRW07_10210 [Alteromonas sediminis]
MNKHNAWQQELERFLAANPPTADTRVVARALASDGETMGEPNPSTVEAIERALQIEQNLDAIGVQPLPEGLEEKLQGIAKEKNTGTVIRGDFKRRWKTFTAIAATLVIGLMSGKMLDEPSGAQPNIAQVRQAEQELLVALHYVSMAQTKTSDTVSHAFDDNIRRQFNRGLATPLHHVKETL